MEYNYLTKEDRLAMLGPRLEQAERQYYEATLNQTTNPDAPNDEAITQAKARLDALRQMETELNAPATPTRTSSDQ